MATGRVTGAEEDDGLCEADVERILVGDGFGRLGHEWEVVVVGTEEAGL